MELGVTSGLCWWAVELKYEAKEGFSFSVFCHLRTFFLVLGEKKAIIAFISIEIFGWLKRASSV